MALSQIKRGLFVFIILSYLFDSIKSYDLVEAYSALFRGFDDLNKLFCVDHAGHKIS